MNCLISDKTVRLGCIAVLLLVNGGIPNVYAENNRNSATKYQNVRVRMEVRGSVVSTPDRDSKEQSANQMPMKINAAFHYEELVQSSKSGIRSVRYYENAAAQIELNRKKEISKLDANNRYVLLNRSTKKDVVDRVAFASIAGRLNQRQWQLIDVPANTTLIDQLIKVDQLEAEKKWKPDSNVLADLLLVHEISESDVEVKVDSIKNGIANLTIHGRVNATDDDVNASIQLTGKIQYNTRTQRVARIDWSIRHKKDEGQVAPGFDAMIKIQVDISPLSAPKKLTTKNIVRVRGSRSINSDLHLESPSRRVEFIHDRRWRSVINSQDVTILRLLDKGQIVGQCNVLTMPHLPSQDAFSLKDFEASVGKAITEKGKIFSATERKTKNGNLVYTIESAGVQDGVELSWTYHHVAQPDGQRAMLVVTTETDLAETIRDSEIKMVDSIRIRSIEQANELRKRSAQKLNRNIK